MTILSYLASFHKVSQTLNISQAARELDLSQPSLSRHLKRLEDSLNVVLFVRQQRGVKLTDEGLRLADSIAPILNSLNEQMNQVKSQGRSTKGRLRVGALAEIGKSLVFPKVLAFAKEYPEVDVEVRLLKGSEIVAAMIQQSLDFGIVAALPSAESLKVTKLTEERSILVTRASNRGNIQTKEEVLQSRFVAYRPDDPLLASFLRQHYSGLHREKIKPVLTINDHKSIIEALLSFDLYAVMPLHSITGYLEAGSLRNASSFEHSSTIWLVRGEKSKAIERSIS